MAYQFDFASVFDYTPVLIKGIGVTVELIAFGAVAGVALGIGCAWARTQGPRWLRAPVTAYVEAVRNTPFLIQLFFVFFGLPSLGVQFSEMQAACLAMALNLGAYSAEIIRAGIDATPKGQYEAGASLAMTRWQVFRHVVLKPALARIWPALSSQIVIVMLGSAVCSQIAAEDLTFAANFIQSRNFRAFEVYFVTTGIYLVLAVGLRQLLRMTGRRLFRKAAR
ncbi:MAG: amino acid ABC transporter permease [Achromobacter sp.]|jgi:polar amino acid transport system permease protein|uniref:L-cystine transport system permease protein YecS n=1 Tax=Achromobacter insuavis TaxID=1287735 RepID=A0A6J5IF12_9BURK|nr:MULTISPECIES: amino acid ABC transporter permease [Achromobacter]MBN9639589.1 amino acid ABC transporter permease [Achromobacter sp.]MCG2597725.1 amino acid ABC transporter permease [Achromobacter sp.]MCG2602338.1 amino acid ABC transporter permease [Achromobacter sp.]CAB3658100.1 L-cystine transport system permease protein YecS [Achromobacter insuavis]CAB3914319.1 L-cystine transport system permease protein YecS [Achromobacter insuavis]